MQQSAFSACGRSGKPAFSFCRNTIKNKKKQAKERYARGEEHGQIRKIVSCEKFMGSRYSETPDCLSVYELAGICELRT